MTIEWSTLNSLSTSCVVIRGSTSMILSTGHCQIPVVLLEPPVHCMLLVVPGPDALLMLQVVSPAFWPILNSNKKIA